MTSVTREPCDPVTGESVASVTDSPADSAGDPGVEPAAGPTEERLVDALANGADDPAPTSASPVEDGPEAGVPAPRRARVAFMPSGRRGTFDIGTPVLAAARALGVDLDSVCGGRGLCGRCQVRLPAGEFPKLGLVARAEHAGERTRVEARYARIHGDFVDARRLGCQTRVEGDLVVDVPPESQVHRQVIRKEVGHEVLTLNPAVRLYVVDVREPDMHEPSGDLRRLREALAREHGLSDLGCGLGVLGSLQKTLRSGNWRVTVAVHEGREILAVRPGYHERVLGLAVDVGSTTIAAHLCDLATGAVLASGGAMNPQIRFGEDLMSRVSHVMMNPGGDIELTGAVRGAIDALLGEVCLEAGTEREDVLEMVLVANPVMHHLLLGIDPVELGGAPFALATDEALATGATELGVDAHPATRAYLLPCVAGHVGADTAGVMLAERPDLSEAMTLLVDVGTNAEIVLGNRDRLLACSSPTGPAFEGAQIAAGQRAAPGAIERVRIDPETLEPRFSVIGREGWSDSAAFAADAAGVGVTGICGSGIIEVVAEMFLAGIIDADGVVHGEHAARSPRIVVDGRTFSYVLYGDGSNNGVTVRVTQNDVRQIQLAKAALYAGVRLLMDRLGVERVERIRLAGAFGSHIDVKYAMVLGLIPDCALDSVSSAGNAAGTGARTALLDHEARRTIERIVRGVEKIETAVEPDFQRHFVDAMAFPHRVDAFPELGRVVALPARPASADPAASAEARRGRRARRGARRG